MGDLISRSALLDEIKDYQMDVVAKATAMYVIRNQPTVDAVPVEEIKNLENPYSTFIECYKCEFDGFETARRHLLLKYEEKVQK